MAHAHVECATEIPMANPEFRQSGATSAHDRSMKDAASEAVEQVSNAAKDAGAKAKRAASETASSMASQVKGLLDDQVGSGASLATAFAGSIRLAADDLQRQSPVMSRLVRNVADKVEDYAEEFQGQTVDQLAQSAANFTRKQPALVFGLAAIAGFLPFRSVKSAGDQNSPSIQPSAGDSKGFNRHG
jgi:hypothetical protein